MNRLHNLLADLGKGRMHIMVRADLKDEEASRERVRRVQRAAKSAVCFDLGDADALAGISVDGFVRLPYPVMWAEFDPVVRDDEDSPKWEKVPRVGVLMVETAEGTLMEGFAFSFHKGHWRLNGTTKAIRQDGKINDWDSFEFVPPDDGGYLFGVVLKACAVMKCTNVQVIENKPSALMRMRAGKNRLPIFSTWTLHIRPDAKQGRDLGGTHSPPRVHLRRGHIRQYKPGLYTWVQPCVVGRKDRGVVHKDYDFHPEAMSRVLDVSN